MHVGYSSNACRSGNRAKIIAHPLFSYISSLAVFFQFLLYFQSCFCPVKTNKAGGLRDD